MIPPMIQTFWDMWLEAKQENGNRVHAFQKKLQTVKTWNSAVSLKKSDEIIKSQPLFPNLLAAVVVIHVKILSAIRTDKKSKKICIKLPATDAFTQMCYVACAEDLYKCPSIIVDNKPESERLEVLTKRFTHEITKVIESFVPTAEILTTYLPLPAKGEDLNMDDGDEEDIPDEDDDVPDLDIPGGGDIEVSKTPGGEHTEVTATDSLTPPSVPGLSPPSSEESLFPDAPLKVEKLPKTIV